jgi:hypothetical protein
LVTIEKYREIALSLPETEEVAHFENIAFRVNKKIFATLNLKMNRGCAKLSEKDQDLFTLFDKTVIYQVPNKWGKHGWTNVELGLVKEEMLIDFLTTAYYEVAPKHLVKNIMDGFDEL